MPELEINYLLFTVLLFKYCSPDWGIKSTLTYIGPARQATKAGGPVQQPYAGVNYIGTMNSATVQCRVRHCWGFLSIPRCSKNIITQKKFLVILLSIKCHLFAYRELKPRLKINYLCTYDLYSPMHKVLDVCISITRGSGRGLGPGISSFLSPVKWCRADGQVPFV